MAHTGLPPRIKGRTFEPLPNATQYVIRIILDFFLEDNSPCHRFPPCTKLSCLEFPRQALRRIPRPMAGLAGFKAQPSARAGPVVFRTGPCGPCVPVFLHPSEGTCRWGAGFGLSWVFLGVLGFSWALLGFLGICWDFLGFLGRATIAGAFRRAWQSPHRGSHRGSYRGSQSRYLRVFAVKYDRDNGWGQKSPDKIGQRCSSRFARGLKIRIDSCFFWGILPKTVENLGRILNLIEFQRFLPHLTHFHPVSASFIHAPPEGTPCRDLNHEPFYVQAKTFNGSPPFAIICPGCLTGPGDSRHSATWATWATWDT
jgi:hypothetical protein